MDFFANRLSFFHGSRLTGSGAAGGTWEDRDEVRGSFTEKQSLLFRRPVKSCTATSLGFHQQGRKHLHQIAGVLNFFSSILIILQVLEPEDKRQYICLLKGA